MLKKEEIKTTIKDFAVEHKKGLTRVCHAGLALSGIWLGWKACGIFKIGNGVVVGDPSSVAVIRDAASRYSNHMYIFSTAIKNGDELKVEDLGKLGEMIVETAKEQGVGVTEFSHFIALGKPIK